MAVEEPIRYWGDMDKPPIFFVPDVPADRQEQVYAHMAANGGGGIPPHADRIYSITFGHDGIEWTATVGHPMRGVQGTTKKVRGEKRWVETPVSDSTVIAAIFPGHPFVIFHTGGRSAWANPFYSSDVKSKTRFSAT